MVQPFRKGQNKAILIEFPGTAFKLKRVTRPLEPKLQKSQFSEIAIKIDFIVSES